VSFHKCIAACSGPTSLQMLGNMGSISALQSHCILPRELGAFDLVRRIAIKLPPSLRLQGIIVTAYSSLAIQSQPAKVTLSAHRGVAGQSDRVCTSRDTGTYKWLIKLVA